MTKGQNIYYIGLLAGIEFQMNMRASMKVTFSLGLSAEREGSKCHQTL